MIWERDRFEGVL